MARLRSRTVYKRVKPIFNTCDSEFGALLARMCVLYEDLRLEVYGGMAESIPDCDQISAMYRKLYFLRRSTITLMEFRGTLQRLSQNEEFRTLQQEFSEEQTRRWTEANDFFPPIPYAPQGRAQRPRRTFPAVNRVGDREGSPGRCRGRPRGRFWKGRG